MSFWVIQICNSGIPDLPDQYQITIHFKSHFGSTKIAEQYRTILRYSFFKGCVWAQIWAKNLIRINENLCEILILELFCMFFLFFMFLTVNLTDTQLKLFVHKVTMQDRHNLMKLLKYVQCYSET